MMEAVKPGDIYKDVKTVENEKGEKTEVVIAEYKVLDKKHWFAGWVPVGEIVDEVNKGIKVILINAPRTPWSKY